MAWIGLEVSRLFKSARQRHRCLMIFDLLIQFAAELTRAMAIDAVSGNIRDRVSAFRRVRGIRSTQELVRHIHRRNRDRLLHRLHTELNQDM